MYRFVLQKGADYVHVNKSGNKSLPIETLCGKSYTSNQYIKNAQFKNHLEKYEVRDICPDCFKLLVKNYFEI